MPIPDFQSLMLPVLRQYQDGDTHANADVRKALAEEFKLTTDEQTALLPSGQQGIFSNRVAWATAYLKRAGLLESPSRGKYRMTGVGKSVLASPPPHINIKFLEQFPPFDGFRDAKPTPEPMPAPITDTPEALLDTGYSQLRNALGAEILDRVLACTPTFFERLVIQLLVAMGYGGSIEEAGSTVGGVGDGGIDGIIKEDRLGLDTIYVQAKRWEGSVGRPEIQKFAGALQGHRATKGVFITTSFFSKDAIAFAGSLNTRLVLIDGKRLADYMIDFSVGVTLAKKYELKKLDSDFFEEPI